MKGDPYWRKRYEIDPYTDEVINRYGGRREALVVGGIGDTGKHTHRIHLTYFNTMNGVVPLYAYSDCGSQKWTVHGGRSSIRISEDTDLNNVDCDKCRGIRVKGGKAPAPPKRPKIDPNTRPKKYKFYYMFDYGSSPGDKYPPNKNVKREVDVKAMNLKEAEEKVVKRINSYEKFYLSEGGRWHNLVLAAVYQWNDWPIWRISSGTEYEEYKNR